MPLKFVNCHLAQTRSNPLSQKRAHLMGNKARRFINIYKHTHIITVVGKNNNNLKTWLVKKQKKPKSYCVYTDLILMFLRPQGNT